MQLGFYVSGTSGSNAEQQLDILSNDMANASTAGYRAEQTSFTSILSQKVTEGPGRLPAAFGTMGRQYVDMSEGGVRLTGNPLDIALRGNAFLRVKMPDGSQAYTRAGDLHCNASGNLLTADGKPVLDNSGSAITLPPGKPVISTQGDISVGGRSVGKLGLAAFSDLTKVKKQGGTLLITPSSNVTPADPKNSSIAQGSLEASNVNPILTMTEMMRVLRSYQSTLKVLDQYNQQMSQLNQQVARVTNN
jgi:flagellar basal body rod protein FlgG